MNFLFILLTGLTLLSLASCQSGMKYNNWSEKDCYYSDYYQTSTPATPDRNYYHSDPVR